MVAHAELDTIAAMSLSQPGVYGVAASRCLLNAS
jgi:hypothetical protein